MAVTFFLRAIGMVGLVVLATLAGVATAQAGSDLFTGRWTAAERDRGVLVTLTIGSTSTLVLPGTGPDGRTEALTLKLRDFKSAQRRATFAVDFPLDEGTAEFEFQIDDDGDGGTLRALSVDGDPVGDDFPKWVLRKATEVHAFVSPNLVTKAAASSALHETSAPILRLTTPETRGEIVRVSLAVGELTTRLARTVSDARRRRAERKAREMVQRDLLNFLAQQAAK